MLGELSPAAREKTLETVKQVYEAMLGNTTGLALKTGRGPNAIDDLVEITHRCLGVPIARTNEFRRNRTVGVN